MRAALGVLARIFPRHGVMLIVSPPGAPDGDRVLQVCNVGDDEAVALLREALGQREGRVHEAPEGKQ